MRICVPVCVTRSSCSSSSQLRSIRSMYVSSRPSGSVPRRRCGDVRVPVSRVGRRSPVRPCGLLPVRGLHGSCRSEGGRARPGATRPTRRGHWGRDRSARHRVRHFASDNYAGVHPEVLAAVAAANVGHVPAYGDDPWTERLQDVVRTQLGDGPSPTPCSTAPAPTSWPCRRCCRAGVPWCAPRPRTSTPTRTAHPSVSAV